MGQILTPPCRARATSAMPLPRHRQAW